MSTVPESPYKGLSAFEDSEADALFFFGREREIAAVAANVLASRLTVLYGPSGVGKSSLVRAGVARRLRELSGAPVVVHDSWAEDPAAALIASVDAECGELGATAGLVDTVAAAAQAGGELHLLLDQFEEYMLYHGLEGPLSTALPELLRRPGLRVNVLLAVRDDALAELDEFAGRIPELFGNLLRLDRLDREAGRAAILGPLARYGELSGEQFTAEDTLVDAVLDEVAEGRLDPASVQEVPGSRARIEAPYLQLVLERLWDREREADSHELRLTTFRQIGGARAIVGEHVHGALERLTLGEQEAAARVVRQLVTPSGRKVSHEPADLAEYADVEHEQLRQLLETLARERIVRGVNGTHGSPTRYEIFHEVLGPPILAWQTEHELRRERLAAHRQRRRLLAVIGAALVALCVVAAVAAYALVQRSDARTQARRARGRALAASALAEIPTNPQVSVRLALQAAQLSPGRETAAVLRSSLAAMRETAVIRLGGTIAAATFAPRGDRLLVAGHNGKAALYDREGRRIATLPRQHPLTTAAWSPDGRLFATGSTVDATLWLGPRIALVVPTQALVTALSFDRTTLLVGSGTHVRLVDLKTHRTRTLLLPGGVVAAALDPTGSVFAVSFRSVNGTSTSIVDAHTGRTVARLPEDGIRSFAFSPNGRLLATGSYDKTARIWDARTGKRLHVLRHHGYVLDESFSPDGRSLVTASSDGAGYVWDVASGQRELLLVGAPGGTDAVAYSPNGSEIALGSADRLARLYYSQDGRLLAPLAGHGGTVTSVGFDPSGRTLVTGSTDGTVRLWNALPEGALRTIDTRQPRSPVQAFWAGNDAVTVAGRQARVISTAGRVLRTVTMPAPITAAAAGPGVAVADASGKLTVVSPSGSRSFEHVPGVSALTFAGRMLLIGSVGGVVEGGRLHMRTGGPVRALAAGGGRVLVLMPHAVAVYTDAGRLVSTIHTTADHATLSPGGLGVATSKGDVAQLWDATTGDLLQTLTGQRTITDVQFAPDGLDLLTTSIDHNGVIWSVRTGRPIRQLIGHAFPVYSGSYSPSGHWIVTASQFTAGLWSAGNGKLLFFLGRHAAALTGASFSPTGNWILTGSKDGTAAVYHCVICQSLPGLEATAAARLRALG